MKMGMVIDLEKCIGCRSCMVACKQHNAQPPQTWWNRVFTPGSHRHLTPPAKGVEFFLPVHCQHCFLPVHCQHCENAPCEKVCPVEATFRAEDGAILIDYDRCIGCRYCMSACPYGVRQFNWEDPEEAHARSGYQENYHYGYPEEHRHQGRLVYEPVRPKGIVEKCTFCVQYRDKGELPACVQGCPGKARFVGDLDDASSEVSKMIKARDGFTLLPEKGTKPTVFYLPPNTKEV